MKQVWKSQVNFSLKTLYINLTVENKTDISFPTNPFLLKEFHLSWDLMFQIKNGSLLVYE